MAPREAIVSGSEVRVSINNLLKVSCGCPLFLVSGALAVSIQVVIALKVCFQCLGIHMPWLTKWHRVPSRDPFLNMTGNILSDVSFKREHIPHVPLVTLGPQMLVRGAMD